MISVKVDIRAVKETFKKLIDRIKNPDSGGLWKRLVNFLFLSWMSETFRLEGARRGHVKWVALSPKYKKWKTSIHHRKKPRKGTYGPYSEKPLIKYGHLQASFSIGAMGNIFKTSKSSMTFGTKIPYAKYHQEGGTKTGRPPKREMVFITDKDLSEIHVEIVKWVMEVLQ